MSDREGDRCYWWNREIKGVWQKWSAARSEGEGDRSFLIFK